MQCRCKEPPKKFLIDTRKTLAGWPPPQRTQLFTGLKLLSRWHTRGDSQQPLCSIIKFVMKKEENLVWLRQMFLAHSAQAGRCVVRYLETNVPLFCLKRSSLHPAMAASKIKRQVPEICNVTRNPRGCCRSHFVHNDRIRKHVVVRNVPLHLGWSDSSSSCRPFRSDLRILP